MGKTFIHLSDIHFGQEKGGQKVIHDDVKERLIEDVSQFVATMPEGCASGIIVSGDIAYAGKKEEYSLAGAWLDRIAGAVGCKATDIQVVPGNHDIDRDQITRPLEWMLQEIVDKGEGTLDEFLEKLHDREMLYARFNSYRPFAEGYDSPLDSEGGHAGGCTVELVPGRTLRFIGFNTALICSKSDLKGKLLLGARQRVLPKTDGQELVVIAHHQLPWLQDSEDALRYLKNRARVFISGHEHRPSIQVDSISAGRDLLMIAAGATIPPTANEHYTYTYNILEFDWESVSDSLCVIVHPRTWSDEDKEFVEDAVLLNGKGPKFILGSPQFRCGLTVVKPQAQGKVSVNKEIAVIQQVEQNTMVGGSVKGEQEEKGAVVSSQYPLLLLRFFRDLAPGQRMAVLVKLGALPDDWSETLTHTMERHVFDSLNGEGRLDELEEAINEFIK